MSSFSGGQVLTWGNRNAGQTSLQGRSQWTEQYNEKLSRIFDALLGYLGCTQGSLPGEEPSPQEDELQRIIASLLTSVGLDTSASASLAAGIAKGGSEGMALALALATVIADGNDGPTKSRQAEILSMFPQFRSGLFSLMNLLNAINRSHGTNLSSHDISAASVMPPAVARMFLVSKFRPPAR